jgi:UDP-N-acetylmuramyl-tripeptide synthetase
MQEFDTPSQAAQWLLQRVSGVLCADSRKLQAGDGFIAWPGAAVDARQFVPAAFKQGATASLVERSGLEAFALDAVNVGSYRGLKSDTGAIAAEFFGAPSTQLAVIAVTGTNGKTSTAWWLAQALSALPAPYAMACGVIGTLGVGLPSAGVTTTGMTTPDPVLLQQTLRQMADSGLKACAIEASSIGIEEHRLGGTQIRVAVFTNFTQDHLDYHGSMELYWQAKQKLFAWPGLASVVVNVDDPMGATLVEAASASALDVWTVSRQQAARLQARNMGYGALGLRFEVVEGDAAVLLQTRMIGDYNISNLLGVLAAMRSLGVPLQEAVDVCATLDPVPGRMECWGGTDAPLVAVDYAHTPDALGQALAALRTLATQRGGRLWCVFGCGGDRDASKRPLMGAIAAQQADQVVVTSDNPRSEKPEAIVAQVLLGMTQCMAVDVQVDRALAIADVLMRAAASDVILLAGKGHEETQETAGTKQPFSDRDHAQRALLARRIAGNGGAA